MLKTKCLAYAKGKPEERKNLFYSDIILNAIKACAIPLNSGKRR